MALSATLGLLVSGGAQAATSFSQRSMAHARADARTQLVSVMLPPGARRTRHDPSIGHSLHAAGVACSKRYVVEDHRFWRVGGKPDAVWAWMLAHQPIHTRSFGYSTLVDQGKTVAWAIYFFLPAQRDVVNRMLTVSLRSARDGRTAIRVDAIAVGEPHPDQPPCFTSY